MMIDPLGNDIYSSFSLSLFSCSIGDSDFVHVDAPYLENACEPDNLNL